VTVPYVDSDEVIANPERGIYDHSGDCEDQPFDREELTRLRVEENITLVRCSFYLEGYQDEPTLDLVQVVQALGQRAIAARQAGVKLIVRLAYSESSDHDAPIGLVEGHIDQLTPILRAHGSVIHVLESGFVGQWGEGHYTHQDHVEDHPQEAIPAGVGDYGNRGTVSDTQWENRKRIVDRLLAALPATGRSRSAPCG
jgi:hypothetical protein